MKGDERPKGMSQLDWLWENFKNFPIASSMDDKGAIPTTDMIRDLVLESEEVGIIKLSLIEVKDDKLRLTGYDQNGVDLTSVEFDKNIDVVGFEKIILTQVEEDNGVGKVGDTMYCITLSNDKKLYAPVTVLTAENTKTILTQIVNDKIYSYVKIDNAESNPSVDLKETENGIQAHLRIDEKTPHNINLIKTDNLGVHAEMLWLDSENLIGFKEILWEEYKLIENPIPGIIYFCPDKGRMYLNGNAYPQFTVLENRVDELEKKMEENQAGDSELKEKIDAILELAPEDFDTFKEVSDKLTEIEEINNQQQEQIDNKVDWINNKQDIVLPNHGHILGISTTGAHYNLVMLSRWNIADFGTIKYPINLNGSEIRPTYNDTFSIALLDDVNDVQQNVTDLVEYVDNTFQEKGNYVEYIVDETNRKHIILDNHQNIVGTLADGSDGRNLIMLSQWDVVDIGSNKNPINLNGSETRPTYNDDKELALLSDVEQISEDSQNLQKELQNLIKECITPESITVEEAKEKLISLGENYSSLFNLAETVKSFLEDSDVVDSTINKWQEIQNFLEGITDSETLTGLLQSLESSLKTTIQSLEEKIKSEEERAIGIESSLQSQLDTEIERATEKENLLHEDIIELNKKEAADRADIDLLKQASIDSNVLIEELKQADSDLQNNINTLENSLNEEISRATNSESNLQNQIDLINDTIEDAIEDINEDIESIKADYLTKEEAEETYQPIDDYITWTEGLNDQKVILLRNNDVIMGGVNKGYIPDQVPLPSQNAVVIAHVNKWNIVDLGSAYLPLNINTPDGVRPTVQEKSQSGAEAYKIAYTKDFDGYLPVGSIDDMLTKTEALEKYATKVELTEKLLHKVDINTYEYDKNIFNETYATKEELKDLKSDNSLIYATKVELTDVANAKLDKSIYETDIQLFITAVEYNSEARKINFYNKSEEIVAYLDANPFIKDGMISNVYIEDGYLVISFNTDAGKEPISLLLTDIFNPENYYQKTEIDDKFESVNENITSKINEVNTKIEQETTRASDKETELENDINNILEELPNKVSWTDKNIVLSNNGILVGKSLDQTSHNLATVSNYNIAEFGSEDLPINLNGYLEHPTYNSEELALLKDIPSLNGLESDVENIYTELDMKLGKEEAKTIYLSKEDYNTSSALFQTRQQAQEEHLELMGLINKNMTKEDCENMFEALLTDFISVEGEKLIFKFK